MVRMEKAINEDVAERQAFGCKLASTKVYDLGTNKVDAFKSLHELGLGEK
jgi:hypothetical protein